MHCFPFKKLHPRPSILGIGPGLLLLNKTRHTPSCQLQLGALLCVTAPIPCWGIRHHP